MSETPDAITVLAGFSALLIAVMVVCGIAAGLAELYDNWEARD